MARTRPPRRLLAQLADPIHVHGVTYQQRWVLCSSEYCDDRTWHGPYWYAFWKLPVRIVKQGRRRVRTGGGTKAKYVGRDLPRSVIDAWREAASTEAAVTREVSREVKARTRRRRGR